MTGIFIDSNVAIYAYADDRRTDRAKDILATSPTISVQVLNEFTTVARRKLGLDWHQIAEAIDEITLLCADVLNLTVDLHSNARTVAERYKLQFYDALVIAAALDADCDTLLSEDMQDGLVIEDRLTVRNPFV